MLNLIYIVGLVVICYFVFYLYIRWIRGTCTSHTDMSGKTVIITGANTGIGYYTAQDLASRNARVILACRDIRKGQAAAQRIEEETSNKVIVKELDVSLMKSVCKFCEEILEEEKQLDVLINNAGITGVKFERTEEGLEKTMATNHFGPFLLTNLLLDLLKKSSPSRIVVVSSIAHSWGGQLDFSNLNGEKYNKSTIYYHTKLANVLFTRELAHRLEGTGVTVNCLHPGSTNTELFKNLPLFASIIINTIAFLFFRSPKEGAQTSIYCAVSEEVNGITGRYFSECHISSEGKVAKDDAVAKKLWEYSEHITELHSKKTL